MRRSAKMKANKKRRGRRLWSFLVRKLTNKSEPELTIDDYDVPIFYEEDPDARFERHMKAIRGEK